MICATCVNYEPEIQHCALLDIWEIDVNDDAAAEDECESYQPDPSLN